MPEEQTGQENANEQAQEDLSTSKLPEDASDRTKQQFEKLVESNKKLKEELEAAKAKQQSEIPSVMDSLRPKEPVQQSKEVKVDANKFNNLNQDQVNQLQSDLTYKGEDGYEYVNTALLNKRLEEANKQAEQARQEAKMASAQFQRFEEQTQLSEAYQKFPQLNPNNKDQFDPNFYDFVKAELMTQAMRGEKNLVKAAQDVDKRIGHYKKTGEAMEKQEDVQSKKEQINATGTVSTNSRYAKQGDDYLREATMRGKPGALAERLRRSGY